MAITLYNRSRRMIVIQTPGVPNAPGFKWRSEQRLRLTQTKTGDVRARRARLKHAPVIRLASGATQTGLPDAVLRNSQVKQAIAERRLVATVET